MSESIWKKDLSFRKKKIDDLPETAESLRVKELAFQQKLAEAAQAAALPAVEEDPLLSLGELGHLDVISRAIHGNMGSSRVRERP